MHLGELKLRGSTHSLWQWGVADDVSQGLSFGLILFVDFPLCVVSDNPLVDEAANIEAFGPELNGHGVCQRCDYPEFLDISVAVMKQTSSVVVANESLGKWLLGLTNENKGKSAATSALPFFYFRTLSPPFHSSWTQLCLPLTHSFYALPFFTASHPSSFAFFFAFCTSDHPLNSTLSHQLFVSKYPSPYGWPIHNRRPVAGEDAGARRYISFPP
jgi:hypothetical protein